MAPERASAAATSSHALVDGDKRLALAATIAFHGFNGVRLTPTDDEAYDLVIAVAGGNARRRPSMAVRRQAGTTPCS